MTNRPISSTSLSDRCNCTMENTSTKNNNHDDACELWYNRLFWDNEYQWDGEIHRLVINFKEGESPLLSMSDNSPWNNADQWIWDGETPVVQVTTAVERAYLPDQGETLEADMCELEYECYQAFLDGGEEGDSGWIRLPDDSWADMDSRVTYRHTLDEAGKSCWFEQQWDEATTKAEPFCDCTNPVKQYFCATHKVKRSGPDSPWEWDDYDYSKHTYSKCSHAFEEFDCPGEHEVDIRISGVRRHTTDTTPDLGVYAAECWNPDAPAIFIPWNDYGLPRNGYKKAAESLKLAWASAKSGNIVEFGCMGGHGRTGTMLACIAILADPDMTPDAAVAHVRATHCSKAIESASQEWYVAWFAAYVRNLPLPTTTPASYGFTGQDDWADYDYGYTTTTNATNVQMGFASDIEYTEVHSDRTITKYKSGKIVTEYATGGKHTTFLPKTEDPHQPGPPGSACVWGEHCVNDQCNYYHPSPVRTAPTTTGGIWCSGCMRTVYTEHNNNCPQNPKVTSLDAGRSSNKGNRAPGATANARRQAEKRARREEAARRHKQKRNRQYVNNRSN